MGPGKGPSTPPENQDAKVAPETPRTPGYRRRCPRSRVCLLKGCERVFRPQQPLARYCSEACREQARRWREWKARRRYRQSANGKQKRLAQCRRYRERRKAEPERKTAALRGREGHPYKIFFHAPFVSLRARSVTAPDATTVSGALVGRPCSGFVPRPAATLWSGFWSARGDGANGASDPSGRSLREKGARCGAESPLISSGHIALGAGVSLSSACGQGEEGGARPARVGAASFSLLLRLEGEPENEAWNWNFINSIFATSD